MSGTVLGSVKIDRKHRNACNNHGIIAGVLLLSITEADFLFRTPFVQHVLYHFFHLYSHIHEIPVKNAFPFLPRLERVELRQWYIRSFLLLDFLHVEIRFAEELRGLELLRFLYVHRTSYTGFVWMKSRAV